MNDILNIWSALDDDFKGVIFITMLIVLLTIAAAIGARERKS